MVSKQKALTLKTGLMTVSPKLASDLLKRNKINRPLQERNIKKISEDISAGKWVYNGEPIIISENGNLLDGQHRLHAVVKSNISVKMMIVTGISEEAFSTIDTGAKRTGADTLAIEGTQGYAAVSAACKWLFLYQNYGPSGLKMKTTVSNQQILETFRNNKSIEDSGKSVSSFSGRKVLFPSINIFIHYMIMKKHGKQMADDFVSGVSIGAGLRNDDPRYLLREKVLSNRMPGARLMSTTMLCLAIKAANSFVKGQKRKTLTYRQGEMPDFV